MVRLWTIIGASLVSATAFASSCPDGDNLLQNNTRLSQLCPNGFTSSVSGQIGDQISQNGDNAKMVVAAAEQNGVPTDVALAVSTWESGLNSCAGSNTGVKGPMQLTQKTARGLGFDRDINEQNVQGGMEVLKQAYDKCGDNTTCLAASYNGSDAAQQADWARGVQGKLNQLKNDSSLIAQACSGGSKCLWTGSDTPTTTTTTAATADPQIAATDTNVGIDDV